MSEEIQTKLNNANANSPNNLLRIIYILIFLLIISFVTWRIFFYKSPQEQLAAIEASLAIPDSENATILYNQLFEDYNVSDLNPVFTVPEVHNITISRSWSSQEYPEVAKWLEDNNEIFEKIIQASKYEKCIFPIAISSPKDMDDSLAAPFIFTIAEIVLSGLYLKQKVKARKQSKLIPIWNEV